MEHQSEDTTGNFPQIGCAGEFLGNLSSALDYYLASAALVSNTIEGAVVCKRAIAALPFSYY